MFLKGNMYKHHSHLKSGPKTNIFFFKKKRHPSMINLIHCKTFVNATNIPTQQNNEKEKTKKITKKKRHGNN
jgi:hypothetical protein